MKSYVNSTRFNAIVTIKIESVENVEFMLETGFPGNAEGFKVKPGFYYDLFVAAGCELRVLGNTVATFVSVRTSP